MPLTVPIRGRMPRRTCLSFGNNWIGHENVLGTVGYPAGIIAQYNFNENNPNDNAEDSSGNGHDMLMQQDTNLISVPGWIGRAFSFNGTTDFGEIADADVFTPAGTPFSFSARIYMHDAKGFYIASKGAFGTTGEWIFFTYTDNKIYVELHDESIPNCYIGRRCTTPLTSYVNVWIHLFFTYDGGKLSSGIKIYLNATQIDNANHEQNQSAFVAVENLDSAVKIGRSTWGSADGLFDQVKFWNRVLSGYEISRQFQNQFSAYRKRRHRRSACA